MIFIDASALVSIIVKESDARILAGKLRSDSSVLCSALSFWETVAALCKNHRYTAPDAAQTARDLLQTFGARYVPIGEREAEIAAEAYATFGKGRHPAALNMGDCFAYACARANNAKLLFEGDDFAKTDIAAA